jgi:predicted secreted protein
MLLNKGLENFHVSAKHENAQDEGREMAGFNFMPFSLPMSLAVYFTAWWVCLFAVLPFGVRNHQEEAETLPKGGDPGAPVAPMLAKKAIATSLLAAVVYAVIVVLANSLG